jgi:hypothetical protein
MSDQLIQLNTNINEINTEVGEQDALLEMINQALEGKVAAAVDRSSEDGLVSRTGTEYINDRVESIGDYAFYRMSTLQNASFAKAKTIGSSAFYSCSSLSTVNAPEAKTIGSSAFYNCYSLSTINIPEATTIGSSAF